MIKVSKINKRYIMRGLHSVLAGCISAIPERLKNDASFSKKVLITMIIGFMFLQLASISSANATTYYNLTIQSPSGSGSTSPSTGTHSYSSGTSVKVTVSPSFGYNFDLWVKDGVNVGSSNPLSVTMSASHTLKATFTQATVVTAQSSTVNKPYVQGIKLFAPDGSPLTLGGFNIATTFSESDFAWIASKGYNSVRVTVYWSSLEPTEGKINWTPLDNTLAWCQKYHIYAIIDFHQFNYSPFFTSLGGGTGIGFPAWLVKAGGYRNSASGAEAFSDDFYLKQGYGATSWAKFEAFWGKMVTRYKSNSYVWAYEIINEPMVGAAHTDATRTACNARYKEIVSYIRAIDPTTCIILHFIDVGFNQDLNASNILWTKSVYSYDGTTQSGIDKTFNKRVSEFNVGFGVPYIISEIGVTPSQRSIASNFLMTAFVEYHKFLNGGTGCWNVWIYGKGTGCGYQCPRTSSGSDSWVQTILSKQVNAYLS
jgi:aryl-phospho-beta-D-glucosidase BglC (GH1 family)